MDTRDYEKTVLANMPKNDQDHTTNFALSLCEEAGEVGGKVKKAYFNGHPFDRAAFLLELGDVAWYLTALALQHGSSLEEVMQLNQAKLARRYGAAGYSHEASVARLDTKDGTGEKAY